MTYPPPPQQPSSSPSSYGVISTGRTRRPGRLLLVLALFVGVLGLGLGAASAVTFLRATVGLVNSDLRVEYGGTGTVLQFDRTGEYVAYHDREDGYPDEPGGRFILTVAKESGGIVEVHDPRPGAMSYDIAGHHGEAVSTFRVDTPGRYRVWAWTSHIPGGTMVFGPGSMSWLPLLGATAAAFAVALLLFVGWRSRRRRPPTGAGVFPQPGQSGAYLHPDLFPPPGPRPR